MPTGQLSSTNLFLRHSLFKTFLTSKRKISSTMFLNQFEKITDKSSNHRLSYRKISPAAYEYRLIKIHFISVTLKTCLIQFTRVILCSMNFFKPILKLANHFLLSIVVVCCKTIEKRNTTCIGVAK